MCATSIGSTSSQSPSPGVRKSGIPLGTEIPAPVRATVHRLSRMRPASSSAAVVDVRVTLEDLKTVPGSERVTRAAAAAVPKSLALPLRRALLEKGRDALFSILRQERGREALLFRLDPLVEVSGIRDLLDLLNRERRLSGQ